MCYTLFSSKHVKTKKEHECWGCLRKIPINTIMLYETWLWENEFVHGYFCDICENVRDLVFHTYELESISEGQLKEFDEWYEMLEKNQKK
ncbi:MAG: hypothetical protein M0Q13_12945 [Methanothrix sp.]|nr:hypothetical protein [Methanothrix sp.]